MPFAPTGIYTPPTGAENAVPGAVIRSVIWNTIFTDISTALTQVGQLLPWIAAPTTLSIAAAYTVTALDAVVLVKANVGTIVMPASTVRPNTYVTIMGAAAGYFGTHSVSVVRSGSDTISSLTSLTLNVDYQSVKLFALSSGGYLITA